MKTLLMAAAFVAVACIAAVPSASADTVVDCALDEEHEPAHCAFDCTPLSDEAPLVDLDHPARCRSHD